MKSERRSKIKKKRNKVKSNLKSEKTNKIKNNRNNKKIHGKFNF